jgi:hypothetical protein
VKLIPRLTALRQFDTCRLIPSRFADLEDSVLAPLADDDGMLRDLFDLDNATNDRLRGESGLLPGIGVDELVFGVPNFRIINAAYTYARPEGSRFNDGERGAWYCAFDTDTALAEVAFHKTVEYQEIGRFDDSVTTRPCWPTSAPASTTCAGPTRGTTASPRTAMSPRRRWRPNCWRRARWASSTPACAGPRARISPASAPHWSAMSARAMHIG